MCCKAHFFGYFVLALCYIKFSVILLYTDDDNVDSWEGN